MKLKLLITILVSAALFSGVVLWRVDRFVYGDRMAWAEAQARTQISSLSQAISSEVKSARRMLSTVTNDTFKREHTNWRAFQPYYALALMTSQGGTMSISRLVSKAGSPAAAWTANDLGQYIGFMGKELESRGTVLFRSFKDPQKNRHVAVIFAGGGNAYILIGSGENFQSLIESQKGGLSAISIVANDGLTISHATQDYIGNVMSDSTLLKEIRSTGAAQGLGSYRQGKQQVFGMYSQIPGTNSYVISSVPTADLLKGRLSLTWQFVFMAIGFVLLGAAVYFWYEKRGLMVPAESLASPPVAEATSVSAPAAPSKVIAKSPAVAAPEHAPVVVTTNSVLKAPAAPKYDPSTLLPESVPTAPMAPPLVMTPQEIQEEKSEAYRQVAAALGNEMRTPLASILGFSQMVLSKTQEPEVVQAVESILREARSSRDVLEKLVTFSGERQTVKSEAKIEGPIMQALKNLDTKLSQKGVKVVKDFKNTSPWPVASEDLVKAFENIFVNAIEAMERMPDKTLRITTWEEGDGLHVRVVDTGEGVEPENLPKVFDPFYTTRSFSQHVGLGLPVAVGIFKEHQAQMQMQSQRGKGTQMDIVFAPVPASMVMTAPKAPPPLAAPELPMNLPKADPSQEQEIHVEPSKITDVNVDSLLELPPEEAPLQFLDGQGFESVEEVNRPTKPVMAAAPPPPPPPTNSPPPTAPPRFDEEKTMVQGASPELMIDRPTAPMMVKKSDLDSYKVEIRRPGKRT